MTDATPTAQRLWRDIVARMPFMSDPLNGTHAMLCKREIADALAAHAAQAVAANVETVAQALMSVDYVAGVTLADINKTEAEHYRIYARAAIRAGQPGKEA